MYSWEKRKVIVCEEDIANLEQKTYLAKENFSVGKEKGSN